MTAYTVAQERNPPDVAGLVALATNGGLPSRAAVLKSGIPLGKTITVAQERNPPDVAGLVTLATNGGRPSRAAVLKSRIHLGKTITVAQERNPPDVARASSPNLARHHP